MYSATELIEALRRRSRRSLRPERAPGEFPAGWADWFASMRERVGAITGATADAIIAIFLQRELARPLPRSGELNRWQAFATLWRQDWHPAAPDSRRDRIIAMVITIVVHIILALLLLWLAYMRFIGGPAAPLGEEIVQVEYIGQGTPEDEGGGAPTGPAPQPAEAASAPAAPASQAAASASAAAAASTTEDPVVPPTDETPPPAQPLVVTEVPAPDSAFTLPPATARDVPTPTVATTEVREAVREIDMPRPQPRPVVRALQPRDSTAIVQVPRVSEQVAEIPVTDIPTRLPAARARSLAPAATATVSPQATVREGVRDIPMPAAATGAGQQASTQQASGASRMGAAPQAGGPPAASAGSSATSAATGAVAKPAARPGAWPTPQRGDDWGASTRNRPGGNTGSKPGDKPGLFNADGSMRLPDAVTGTQGQDTGFPPGSDGWTKERLDRAGTWLKRPPNRYTPTRFDEYWIPSGTLLEEWVRRGIKNMSIPIPGSDRRIVCTISILQLGGGCGVDGQIQPSTGKPPPDVPFKPELQEDQDSLRKPPP